MINASATPEALSQKFRNWLARTDTFLLVFLLAFTVDSVVIKPVALICALFFLRKSVARLRFKDAPFFYLLIPAMEILRFVFFNKDFSSGHAASFGIGICYWLMCYAAFLIVRLRVTESGGEKISTAMNSWFFINAAYSVFQLVMTMVHSHSINPYGISDVAYGNSTGDYVKGILLAPCYINMFINSFFAVWFLHRRQWRNAILATLLCWVTTTNFANIIFLPMLGVMFFVFKEKKAKFTIAASIGLFFVFSMLIARGNIAYMRDSMRNVSIESMSISAADADTNNRSPGADSARRASKRIIAIYRRIARPNGKVLSWQETWKYAISSPAHAAFGAGIGNFSSLLALRTAHLHGRQHSRFYEHIPQYVHPEYYANHYQIMKDVYALPEGYHSARHMPHSFPNNIVGEYGLLGVLFFLVGYVWYFLKRGAGKGFFLFILLLAGAYLWFDYLFEYLSVFVFFELFFWVHFNETIKAKQHAAVA